MVGVLRIAVITLQLSNVVLLSALLVTPARKHPISPQRFAHLLVHSSLGRWCVADAMILSYLTVVKAAFAVSFTSPCLYYALKFNRKRDPVDAPDSNPHFYTLTLAVLCIGPFVWALPTILIPISRLVHDVQSLQPIFHSTACIISDSPAQVVNLVLILLPLTLAILISVLLLFILWRYYKLPNFRRTFSVLEPIRLIRFVALVSTIIVSATLYSIVMVMWVRHHTHYQEGTCFHSWLATSSLWEAMCPCIIFCIFAAQEEVYTVWYGWLRQLWSPITRCSCSSTLASPTDDSHDLRYSCPTASRLLHWLLGLRTGPESVTEGTEVIGGHSDATISISERSKACDKNASYCPRQEMPRYILAKSFSLAQPSVRFCESGLSPPPRSPRSRCESPQHMQVCRKMPSLTAFGGRVSGEGASGSSRSGNEVSTGEAGEHSQISEVINSYESQSATIHSSGTFGHP
ncbi:hypothetical protein AcW2_000862 [Taiwanofungus camphoratus]|nr:hypothetical protein AcW2_000862 [Antrodia cinnamomea]